MVVEIPKRKINESFSNMHFDLILIANELFFILDEQSKDFAKRIIREILSYF